MIIGRLCMRITQGTVTFLCKVKIHRGDPLNEDVDDLSDLGRTIDPEHTVWTTRSNRMVFSWIDGQKKARTSTWSQGVRNGVQLGAGQATGSIRVGRTEEGTDLTRAEMAEQGSVDCSSTGY